jgi:hypothetical protein
VWNRITAGAGTPPKHAISQDRPTNSSSGSPPNTPSCVRTNGNSASGTGTTPRAPRRKLRQGSIRPQAERLGANEVIDARWRSATGVRTATWPAAHATHPRQPRLPRAMIVMVDGASQEPQITLLMAFVHEEQQYHTCLSARKSNDEPERPFVVRTPPGAQRVGVRVVLSAVLDDGRTATADTPLGISGSLDISRSEVYEQLDRLLGRDPRMRRPPRLAWGPLTAALESIGVKSSEAELIATPLEVRFEPSTDDVVAPD